MVVTDKRSSELIDIEFVQVLVQKVAVYLLRCHILDLFPYGIDYPHLFAAAGRVEGLDIQLIDRVLHGDVTCQIPTRTVYQRTDKGMGKNAMQYKVEVIPDNGLPFFFEFFKKVDRLI